MDNSKRLLAMLNSTSSPPPQHPSTSQTPLGSGVLSPPLPPANPQVASQGRESSSPFAPPPQGFQSVTLQDLFKNITPPIPSSSSPGVSRAPHSTSGSMASSPAKANGGNDQANKLLGMLRGLGSPPPPPGAMSPSGGDPAIMSSGHASPFVAGEGAQTAQSDLKSPPRQSAPVITHEQPSLPPQLDSNVAPSKAPAANPFASPPLPAAASPPIAPKKSIFDFVSPFDAFEAPKPKSTPPIKSKDEPKSRAASSSVPKPNTKPPAEAKSSQKDSEARNGPKEPSVDQVGSVASTSNVTPAAPATPGGSTQHERSVSVASPAAPKFSDTKLPYLVHKVIGQGTGTGPKTLGGSTTVRLDKPNLDALVSDKEAVQVVPFAKINSDVSGWHAGRTVGLTAGWVAYALHKGRIRLMDRQSGAKLVLQLPSSASQGSIIDIATTSTRVAVISANHAVTVFSVPSSWAKDDPPTEEIAHISPDSEKIGLPERVEWIKRNDKICLAIGGSAGVVIVEINEHQEFLSQIVESNKVLTTDGSIVSFCINSLQQAIALLSSTNHLSLYNVATLNRVWHKKLPFSLSTTDGDTPEASSIQFCESMLLVGRENDTIFDLVQITVDLSVLFTIDFQIPPPGISEYHFGRAVYDHKHHILWVSQFSRGSLYALHFDLTGRPPIKVSEGEKAIAFNRMAEYPLESMANMVLQAVPEGGVEMFYATPTGMSLATITKDTLSHLERDTEAAASNGVKENGAPVAGGKAMAKTDTSDSKKNKATPQNKAASKLSSPGPVKGDLPEDESAKDITPEKKSSPGGGAVADEDLQKLLKKTEDRMITQFRQALSQQINNVNTRIDGLANGGLANEVSAKVEKAVKASVTSAIQNEIKRSLIPAISTAVQNEMSLVASQQIPAVIQQNMREMPVVVEKAVGPAIQRGVAVTVMQAMDKSIADAMQRTIIPTISSTVDHTVGTISKEIRSELLQIRKDLTPIREAPASASEPLIRDLAAAVAALQKQVSDLSAQLSRGPPPSASFGAGPAMTNLSSMPSMPSTLGSPPGPPPLALPTSSQLEEVFLGALSQVSTPATLGLVNEYYHMTDYILPTNPGARSPLAQAILLTLLHRISLAIAEVAPSDPTFTRAISWERRVAQLLDPRDPDTAQFWGRIIPMVQSGLAHVLQTLGSRFGGDPNVQRQMGEIRGVLDLLASKA